MNNYGQKQATREIFRDVLRNLGSGLLVDGSVLACAFSFAYMDVCGTCVRGRCVVWPLWCVCKPCVWEVMTNGDLFFL